MMRPHVSTGNTSTAGTPARNARGPSPNGGGERRIAATVARARTDGTSDDLSGIVWSASRGLARTNESGNAPLTRVSAPPSPSM
jgi:hypothetical protein